MIRIFYTYICQEKHDELMATYLTGFSSDFQKKIKRFRRWQDAQLSLLGRILLFKGVQIFGKTFTDQDLKFTDYHKPYFENSSLKFNISHSKKLVLCLLSEISDVGVDVEWMTDINISDFKNQMTSNEWDRVQNSSTPLSEFYTYWTQKEAVIKAHGEGLSIPLKSFEIVENKTVIHGEFFFLQELFLDDEYKCFISSRHNINETHYTIEEYSALNVSP